MNALVLSGGGAKGAFTAGVVYQMLENGMAFELAVGTSTGSLVGGPALLEDKRYLRNVYVGVDDPDILENSWLGKLAGIILGTTVPLQADMGPLHALLRDYYITKGKLNQLKSENKIMAAAFVDVHTGQIEYVSSADVPQKISAETFVCGILASASEPVFTKPIQVFKDETNHPLRDNLFYDGGVREFLPLEYAANEGATSIWAVSTHPPQFSPTAWGNTTSPEDVNILKALKWVIDTTLNEVERGDLFRALAYYRLGRTRDRIRAIAASEGFDNEVTELLLDTIDDIFPDLPDMVSDFHVIYPSRPMSASLEFDPDVMLTYFTNGLLEARAHFDNGDPQFVDAGDFVFDLG